MNLNAGKAYRARLGFAGLLGTVVLVVGGKAMATQGDQPAALALPSTSETGQPSTGSASSGEDETSSGDEASGNDDGAVTAAPTPSAATGSTGTSGAGSTGGSGSTASGASGSAASSGTSGTRTVTGDAVDTRYGAVQVQLVISGNKITDVVTLQVPDRERRDIEINSQAVPILRQEVLTVQSAKIDAVSGASYTSSGYAWSVQSAIDKAGLG
ncbi:MULTISPECIES: FMN-binding protein [Pseudofrankia]|uniref:FMN-binding protein n=1 Tax=Pseudofrankia TaxID=2994363 RepID=UPI000234C46D|nr:MULTISPECIES: FMN-binding protein [Pseudofrankia]OHV42060.1 FMN-binding protein [Pseudofrankia sp. EUN1h]